MRRTNKDQAWAVEKGSVALLVIDVQQGLFEKSTPIYKAEELLHNINALVERAHQDGVPVFYIQHSDQKTLVKGAPMWQLHPRLQPKPMDCLIFKHHGNAFKDTDLDEALKSKNITSLVVTGLVTHGCVRATCRGGKELGYRVILVEDGHSNYSTQASGFIDKWNQKLRSEGIEIKPTVEIEY